MRIAGSVYGFDGGKLVKGRKRHFVVDSLGFVIGMLVTEANASELQVIWVDQGYSGKNFAANVQKVCGEKVRVEVIKRNSLIV